ncbi:diguanylate cyclase [Hahella sp. KA22]|uniref:diguanylate cyclase n=1 Tax=Hahella sp. KA22 TaxID=1628392 RepID=UPI000FDF429E|nr:diguanylate cyclase [Hahella sp. KA22]AZZ90141.1 GGDEF domain-containing protein [Hahella sp. KA22]QAY53511.1 diguanylate cyclase [Hahella sp. KA22]
MPRHSYTLACLVFVLLFAQSLEAADGVSPFNVDKGLDMAGLTPHLALLEDPSQSLRFEEVSSPDFADRFKSTGGQSPNFGFSESAWWVRFTLKNTTAEELAVTLRQDYPLIDHLTLWEPLAGGAWKRHATGDRLSFYSRDVEHRDYLFPLKLPANASHTYYMRFSSDGSMNIGLSLYAPDALLEHIGKEQLAYGAYYGGFLVLVIYNFFMFIAVRDRTFAHYLLYVTSYGLYMAVHNGLTFQFLWPNFPWFANHSLLILLILSLLGALQFARSILVTQQIAPRTDFAARVLEWLMLISLACTPFFTYHTMIVPISLLTFVIAAQLLLMGVLALMAGSRPARYYMTAWTALLIGVLAYMLKTFGLLPHNVLTQNGFQIGSLTEMVLLSLALSSRVNELQRKTYTDALTGLFNRRHFDDKFATEFHRAQQSKQPLTLLVIDIDCFKQFNDTYGHNVGDHALKEVARILAKGVRKPNCPCRYGGEEFAVILPNTDHEAAMSLANRLRVKVAEETESGYKLSISVGVASMDHDEFDCPNKLFERADYALYTAKQQGRNRVVDYRSCAPRRESDISKESLVAAES